MNGADVCVLGLSCKADIDDDRASPLFEIIELLQERGANVSYCERPVARRGRKRDLGLSSVPARGNRSLATTLVLSTAHKEFKNPQLYAGAKIVVDTRNSVVLPEGSSARLYRA